jgi:hypothetical protein
MKRIVLLIISVCSFFILSSEEPTVSFELQIIHEIDGSVRGHQDTIWRDFLFVTKRNESDRTSELYKFHIETLEYSNTFERPETNKYIYPYFSFNDSLLGYMSRREAIRDYFLYDIETGEVSFLPSKTYLYDLSTALPYYKNYFIHFISNPVKGSEAVSLYDTVLLQFGDEYFTEIILTEQARSPIAITPDGLQIYQIVEGDSFEKHMGDIYFYNLQTKNYSFYGHSGTLFSPRDTGNLNIVSNEYFLLWQESFRTDFRDDKFGLFSNTKTDVVWIDFTLNGSIIDNIMIINEKYAVVRLTEGFVNNYFLVSIENFTNYMIDEGMRIPIQKVKITTNTNLYERAFTYSEALSQLPKGSQVELTDKSTVGIKDDGSEDIWYFVITEEGGRGWVHEEYLSIIRN